jgi:hypothetical protein
MIPEATTSISWGQAKLSPYVKFKMALKSKEVQRQYPSLLQKFLDDSKFEGLDIERKASKFYDFVKSTSTDDVEDLVIRFVLLQKERIDNQEITPGTLRNYIKAIKLSLQMESVTKFFRHNICIYSYHRVPGDC